MNLETEFDRAREREVADAIEAAWKGCKVHSLGNFSAVDWWIESRDGRMAWLAELKGCNFASTVYPRCCLSVRKWLDLQCFAFHFGRPTFFFMRFTDCVRYIDFREVTGVVEIIRNSRDVARNDREPVIMVPVATMLTLGKG